MFVPLWCIKLLWILLGIVGIVGIILILWFAYMGYQFLKVFSKGIWNW